MTVVEVSAPTTAITIKCAAATCKGVARVPCLVSRTRPPPSAIDLLQGGWHVGPYGDALWIRPFLVDFDYHVGPPIHVLAYDWLEVYFVAWRM